MGWINTDRNGKVSEKSWQDTGEWRQVALRRFEPHKSCANTKTANCKPSRAFHREPWLLLNHKHTVNGNCEARASRFTFDRSSLISESRPSRDRMEQSRNKSKQNKKNVYRNLTRDTGRARFTRLWNFQFVRRIFQCREMTRTTMTAARINQWIMITTTPKYEWKKRPRGFWLATRLVHHPKLGETGRRTHRKGKWNYSTLRGSAISGYNNIQKPKIDYFPPFLSRPKANSKYSLSDWLNIKR